MKRTRDKEARARAVDPAKNIVYSGDGSTGAGGGGYIAPANLLDETAHDALDHTGLTGVPSISGLLDETAHDALDHTGLTGCGGALTVTNGKEVALTTTGATTIATRTPAEAVNVLIGIYFRVITATTTVTVALTYTDATGAQTNTLLNAQSCVVGSYSLPAMLINVTAAAITVSITAGTADQVFGSASILEVA